MLVVHPSVPAQSVKDLITLARSRPMQLTYASAGIASAPHLAGELLMMLSGIKMIHVPYKGGSQAMIDVISGQVMMYFSSLPSGLPHVRSGKVRALGLTGSKRSIAAPEIPTLQETGAPGYEISNWYALFVPRATPQAIIARLNTEIVKVLKSDSVQKRVSNDEGMEIVASSPEELAEFLKSEIVNNAKLIRRAGIRAD
jgi:tripartite-type tricarboxylate transporter receptor subunit TctC